MPEFIAVCALLAMAAGGGYQIGHKRGEAFALRLHRHKVDLLRWYAEEPRVIEHARAKDQVEALP